MPDARTGCLRCSGTRLVAGVLGGFMGIGFKGATKGGFFSDTGLDLTIRICRDCGHIEFRAKSVEGLNEKIEALGVPEMLPYEKAPGGPGPGDVPT